MNAKTLIDNLHRRGVRLRIDGEVLRWFGPVGVMTETDLSTLRRHKGELLAALATPDSGAFEKRAAIGEHDGGLPRQEAKTLAAGLHRESVARWAAEIGRLAKLRAISPDGAEALRRAQAFIGEGWALQSIRLGWDEAELFGVCPRAP